MSDVTAERHKLYWLPNALTVSRILLIPVLVWGIIWPFKMAAEGMQVSSIVLWSILGLFALCMFTDFLDGYWARKWHLTSDFGRMLDPIADKLLVAACLISICITNQGALLITVPALIIIGRDVFVSGIREHAANSNIILSPTKLAKWKTMFEMLAILFYLLAVALASRLYNIEGSLDSYADSYSLAPHGMFLTLFIATLWLAAILSAYTGFHYFRSAMRGKPTG